MEKSSILPKAQWFARAGRGFLGWTGCGGDASRHVGCRPLADEAGDWRLCQIYRPLSILP